MEQHHRIIKSLIAEVRNLRQQLEASDEAASYREGRWEERNQELRDTNDRIERERESERREQQQREWQREDIQNQIDRAERFGNDYKADKLRKELRSL